MENKKYVVKVVNVFANLIEVEAKDQDDARQKAKEIITNKKDNENIPLFYELTVPEEHWGVIEKEEYDRLKAETEAEQKSE